MVVHITGGVGRRSAMSASVYWSPYQDDLWQKQGYRYALVGASPSQKIEPVSDPIVSLLHASLDFSGSGASFSFTASPRVLFGHDGEIQPPVEEERIFTAFPMYELGKYRWQTDPFKRSLFHDLVMKNPDGTGRRYDRDNIVEHHTLHGKAVPRRTYDVGFMPQEDPLTIRKGPGSIAGYSVDSLTGFPAWRPQSRRFDGTTQVGVTPYSGSHWWLYTPGTYKVAKPNFLWGGDLRTWRFDATAIFEWLRASPRTFTHSNYPGESIKTTISGVRWKRTDFGWELQYTMTQEQWNYVEATNINRTWLITVGVWLERRSGSWSVSNDWREIVYRVRGSYTTKLIEGWGLRLGPSSDGFVDTPFDATYNRDHGDVFPTSSPYVNDMVEPAQVDASLIRISSTHGRYWHAQLGEIRRSAAYAYQRALEKNLTVVQNNYIEVANELKGLPGLVPNVKGLIQLIRSLKMSDLLSGALKLGDLVASENLKYNFGIAPTVGVVQELNALGLSLARRVVAASSGAETRRISGSFRFSPEMDLPGFKNASLLTTCVAEITVPKDPFWFALMSAYAVRILPSTKNIWEIIPMSFAVDWFTNISGRFGSLDLSFLSIFIQVNSISLSYKVTSDVDAAYGALFRDLPDATQTLEDATLSAAFYRRESTKTTPLLYDGVWDYLAAAGSPELGIVGSLVVSLNPLRR